MKQNYFEKTLKSDRIYDGKILSLRVDTIELPDMKYAKREIVEHKNGVCIIAIDKDEKLYFVKQYRIAVNDSLLELPAGLLEIGEDPKEAGLRELREEIGKAAHHMQFLFEGYVSPGFCTEKITFFLATDLYDSPLPGDDDEFLEVHTLSIDEAIKRVESCEIVDLKTIIGIQYAQMWLEKSKFKDE